MQSNLEAIRTYLFERGGKCLLQGGFTAAENDGIEQATALLEEFDDLTPGDAGFSLPWNQFTVVTVTASPGTALTEDHCGQFSRIIKGGHRSEAADLQFDFI